MKPCSSASFLQVLRYFDYVFTGVFTFEMVIKVRNSLHGVPVGLCMCMFVCSSGGWREGGKQCTVLFQWVTSGKAIFKAFSTVLLHVG